VNTKNEERATQLKPYDNTMWEHWSMYDNMPYNWDPDLNVEKIFKYISGNIIKSYRCKLDEPYELNH
jgi:hypothetical protein